MKPPISPDSFRNLPARAVLTAACLLLAGSSFANNLTVTTLADSGPGSLREAIAALANNGTINFQAGLTGTITLTSGELDIGRNLTIIGPGAAALTISGNNNSRVFNISSSGATVSVSGLTISGGKALGSTSSTSDSSNANGGSGQGGGILNSGALTLTGCNIVSNSAKGGDCVYSAGDDSNAVGGDGDGGGVYSQGTLTLVNCEIAKNTAEGGYVSVDELFPGTGNGAGIFSSGAFVATNCTIDANSAIGGSATNGADGGYGNAFGGGVHFVSGSLVNCTIANNSATGGNGAGGGNDGEGGGIDVYPFGSGILVLCCTISSNVCKPGIGVHGFAAGGGIQLENPVTALTLENTIVSGNTVAANADSFPPAGPDLDGPVIDGGFNLIGQTDGSSGWGASIQIGTTAAPFDPLLGPLQNNGGPTPTMAPALTSAVVDQGNSFGLTTDQRGSPRPFDYPDATTPNAPGGDGSDIGAVELPIQPSITGSVNAHEFALSWAYDVPGYSPPTNKPIFGLQKGASQTGGIASDAGGWLDFTSSPVRVINGHLMARDNMVAPSAFFRLSTSTTNNTFIPPPVTQPASQVTNYTATFNGITIPVGNNTVYWFEYGTDTNYSLSTLTNSLATSTNPASLTYPIGGLNPLTHYHFQLVVMDDWGTQGGGDQTFTTKGLLPVLVTYSIQDGEFGPDYVVAEATVNGEGTPALAYFEYGTTTSYGMTTPNYYTQNSFDTEIFTNKFYFEGLITNTLYHFRAVGFNSVGKGVGADYTFYTGCLDCGD